jgi:hypothetical protein
VWSVSDCHITRIVGSHESWGESRPLPTGQSGSAHAEQRGAHWMAWAAPVLQYVAAPAPWMGHALRMHIRTLPMNEQRERGWAWGRGAGCSRCGAGDVGRRRRPPDRWPSLRRSGSRGGRREPVKAAAAEAACGGEVGRHIAGCSRDLAMRRPREASRGGKDPAADGEGIAFRRRDPFRQ